MQNYKTIILLGILIVTGIFFWWQMYQIDSLEKEVLVLKQTIQNQDNKIKEQISLINMLEAESKTKETAISGLQELIAKNQENCQETINNMNKIGLITSEGKSIEIPTQVKTDNSQKEIRINVVDEETGKKFINFRNNILSNYK